MPFKPGREPVPPDYKRLLGILNNSTVRQKDNPLYEVVRRLLEWGGQQNKAIENQINTAVSKIEVSVGSGGGGSGSSGGGTTPPITVTGDEWSVLTNGDLANPDLIYAGGDVIMLNW